MIAYNAWNLVTAHICEIEIPDFVSMYRWYGYNNTYNFKKKLTVEVFLFCLKYIVNYESCRSYGAQN